MAYVWWNLKQFYPELQCFVSTTLFFDRRATLHDAPLTAIWLIFQLLCEIGVHLNINIFTVQLMKKYQGLSKRGLCK